jgi:outer membrane protein OmpA-like peptidoglycan-associated protein
MRFAPRRRAWLRFGLPVMLSSSAPWVRAFEARITGLQMPDQALSFPDSALTFPRSELDFPSSLVRTEHAGAVEVNLPADVLFDFDKAELRPDARETLHELGVLLLERSRRSIAITGHTDAIGTDAYNQRLSERRAVAVKTWLVSREGIKSPPIATSGRGARDPIAPNRKPDGSDDPEGRQLNRRVTILFRN